jgi:hypothetical protein
VGGKLLSSRLKLDLPRACRKFKTSMEAVNGVTYCSDMKSIVPIDFIDISVVSGGVLIVGCNNV